MALVSLRDVSVDLTVYNSRGRGLREAVLRKAVGGRLSETRDPSIVVISALKDITVRVFDGDRVGIIGGNGAGKTTLLRVVSGVYSPTGGDAEIHGRVSSLIDLTMGMDAEATGYENIVMRGIMLGLDRQSALSLRDDVAEFSQLGPYLDLPIRTYSSGMLLRLAFAVCTSIKPEILIFDEIIGVGDSAFAERALQRLDHLVSYSNIMFLASHDDAAIQRFCNRVIWLREGRLERDGPPDEVLAAYAASRFQAAAPTL
jgi:ABC-2 type transport system ATP-binding protein/lipopolysaccharide transport system ATP-binding protein